MLFKENIISGWRIVLRAHAQIYNKFQRNSFSAHGNFVKQNMPLYPSMNYLFIIIIYIITAVLLLINTIIIQLMQSVIIILTASVV